MIRTPVKPDSKTFKELAETLQAHYEPKPLVIAERFYFHSRSQKPGESIGEFVAELRRLATNCKFGYILPQRSAARQTRVRPQQRCDPAPFVDGGKPDSGQGRRTRAGYTEAAEHNARKLKQGDSEQVHRMGPQRRS